MSFKVYIPARFAASRLPGKPLLEVAGKSLLRHVFERARDSGAVEVVIATDDDRIADEAKALGAVACMTSPAHGSGTDRIAEAAGRRGESADTVIVNLQADEPLMPAAVIRQVAALVSMASDIAIGTVCEPLAGPADLVDADIVKVVRGRDDRALYFSRAPIPWDRAGFSMGGHLTTEHFGLFRRHVGIYGYTVNYLRTYVDLPRSDLERLERLEQLRALANGDPIAVPDAIAPCGMGVDTPEDLERLRRQWPRRIPHE